MASREEVGGGGGAPKLSSSVKLVLLGEAAVGKVGFFPLITLIVAVGEGPCARHRNVLREGAAPGELGER